MAEPIRELVVQKVETLMRGIKTDAGDTYSQTVQTVERDSWSAATNPPRPSIWIVEGDEKKVTQGADIVGSAQCMLPVVITYAADATRDTGTVKNRMLADLTRALGAEFTITDAYGTRDTVQVVEVGNTTCDGHESGLVWVQSLFELSYHHALGDQTRIAEE